MDDHIFNCHETCKQQNDILQMILNYNNQYHLFIYSGTVGVKHAFYVFYACSYLEIDFYFQSLLNINANYGCRISTLELKFLYYCLFL